MVKQGRRKGKREGAIFILHSGISPLKHQDFKYMLNKIMDISA